MPKKGWLLSAEKSVASICRKGNGSFMPKDDSFAALDYGTARHDASRLTGRPAKPCRSARPHTGSDADQCRRLLLQFAVERRLGEKSASRLENLIGAA